MDRYREIAVAFSRNGFGFFVKELGLDQVFSLPRRIFMQKNQQKHRKTAGERIRSFLEELGPTFIKLGQMASTRPDLIPKNIIKELEKLQDGIRPMDNEDINRIIEQELGAPADKVFQKFDFKPVGVASIGQVHQAVLKSGQQVAVKVQRPNIKKSIHTDIEILKELAERADQRVHWARKYQVREIVEELSDAIIRELDFVSEGRNADLMAKQFESDDHIIIPDIYWDYTTKRVLTMEYIDGIKVNAITELQEKGYDTKRLAERIMQAVYKQIFKEGFFHGDPHTGNLLALPGEKIAMIDFGMTGRLSQEMKTQLAHLLIALVRQKSSEVIKAVQKMGAVKDGVNHHVLSGDIDQFLIKYDNISKKHMRLGESITDLYAIANKHDIAIPTDLTLVGKAILTMEGVVEQLDPEADIVGTAEPFGKELIKEQYHPKQLAEDLFEQIQEYGDVIHDLPIAVKELTTLVKKRKLPIQVSIPEADSFFKKLDRIGNLLSFSIVLLAFSLIMVGLIIGSALGRQTSLLWDIPAIEVGFVIAMLMFSWMMYSIFKSGRF
ncbi:ABC transporter [Gracilibacillus oryzae]|uniref:ABC transporter n=1 Tax=Gracilibacillus oryzae TaxID=1672701 RepID=A0A7C8GRZ6_9BACI|nr:lipopolysaccharide core heptose(II) kinase RfaY [Gracilibacillus oryzae]KAB8130726.1 ABC transporter [Gracilibacillus oryzae]